MLELKERLYVKHVENELNNKPKQKFNFDTPNEIYKKKIITFLTCIMPS